MPLAPLRIRHIEDLTKLITGLSNDKLVSLENVNGRLQMVALNKRELIALFHYANDGHLYAIDDILDYRDAAPTSDLETIAFYNNNNLLVSLKKLKIDPPLCETLKGASCLPDFLLDINHQLLQPFTLPTLSSLTEIVAAYARFGNKNMHRRSCIANNIPNAYIHPTLKVTRNSLARADVAKLVTLQELKLRKHIYQAKKTTVSPEVQTALDNWLKEIENNTAFTKQLLEYELTREKRQLYNFTQFYEALGLIKQDKTLAIHKKRLSTFKHELETLTQIELKNATLTHNSSKKIAQSLAFTLFLLCLNLIIIIGFTSPVFAAILSLSTCAILLLKRHSLIEKMNHFASFIEKKMNRSFNPPSEEKQDIHTKIDNLENYMMLAEALLPGKSYTADESTIADFKAKLDKSQTLVSELKSNIQEIETEERIEPPQNQPLTRKEGIFHCFFRPKAKINEKIQAKIDKGLEKGIAFTVKKIHEVKDSKRGAAKGLKNGA